MNIEEMIQGNPQALVTSYNGVLVADSLEVADRFGKAHKTVLRSIEEILNNLAAQNCATKFFIPADYQNRGRTTRGIF